MGADGLAAVSSGLGHGHTVVTKTTRITDREQNFGTLQPEPTSTAWRTRDQERRRDTSPLSVGIRTSQNDPVRVRLLINAMQAHNLIESGLNCIEEMRRELEK